MPTNRHVIAAEKRALKALLRWWREDVKPRRPGEDNPACSGPPYDTLWNAAKVLHHARRQCHRSLSQLTRPKTISAPPVKECDDLERVNASLATRVARLDASRARRQREARYLRWIVQRDPVILGLAQKRRLLRIAAQHGNM